MSWSNTLAYFSAAALTKQKNFVSSLRAYFNVILSISVGMRKKASVSFQLTSLITSSGDVVKLFCFVAVAAEK